MARTRLYPPSVDPGFPRLPETPKGWSRTTFGQVLEAVERPVKLDPDKTYQLVTARRSRGGIVSRGALPGREILTKTQFETKAGDFLISRRQIIHGACGVVPPELDGAVVSNEYSTLRTRPALLMDFLRQYAHTPYFQRTCFHSSHGVDVEKMVFKLEQWLCVQVDVPPTGEQRKIAAILSSVDEAIEFTLATIEQLQVVKDAVMAELFTRGIPQPSCRFKSFDLTSWRLGRVASELAEIPEDWHLTRIVDVAKLESGHTPSRRHPEYWNGGVSWVSLHDTESLDSPSIERTAQEISVLGLANSSARLLPAGTVVFSRTATVGKSTVLAREMATSQDFANYVCGPALHNRYLMHLLRHMEPEWDRLKAGSTHKTVYMPVFEQLQILLPPFDEQVAIARAADDIELRISAERFCVDSLEELKSALLSALLTGEIRVTPTPEAP